MYVGVHVGADAAQENGPDDLDLRDCTDCGGAVVRVGPVPLFVEGADNVCPVWWQGLCPVMMNQRRWAGMRSRWAGRW